MSYALFPINNGVLQSPLELAGHPLTQNGVPIDLTLVSNANLVAIGALTTASFGRGLLEKTNGAGVISYIGAATSAQGAKADSAVQSVSVASANGVSGSSSGGTTPTLTIALGAITPTSVNGLTLVAAGTGFTVAGGTTSKTLTVSDNVALASDGTGTRTLNIGAGGTLGTAAFTAASAYATAAQGVTTLSLATPGVLYTTPVTFSNAGGAWTGTLSLITQTANTVLAGPTSGGAATPTFRALVAADIPASFAPLASPTFTGTPAAPTASAGTSTTQIATTAFVTGAITTAVTGLLNFKGTTDCSANPNYPSASKGDAYIVSVAGKIGGASGTTADVGDWYIATANNAGGTEASVGTSWGHMEHNLVGALLASNNLSDLGSATTARGNLGLGNVENTALSTWTGSANITTLGTIASGAVPTTLLSGTITNAQLAGSIAYSKLSLTGAILNADLAGSIAYSKLSLTGAILNADLAGSIAYAKLSLTNSIVSGDIVSLAWGKLTSTPTTISGYGITDFNSLGDARWGQLAANNSFSGNNTFTQQFLLAGTLTPTALAADQNDYSPTSLSTAATLRVDGGASDRNLTGLAGGADGRIVEIVNIGTTNVLVLKDQNSSSTAANRFLNGADVTIGTNKAVVLRYDGTSSRWRAFDRALVNTGVTAGTYGSSTQIPSFTVDVQGRISAVSNNAVTVPTIASTSNVLKGDGAGNAVAATAGTDFLTPSGNTTGSAASLSISGQTGLLTFTGLASTNRIKTVRDAADTILELGGSYTPTGTWTSMPLTTPKITTGINDANGNSMLAFSPTASAVDGFTFTNAATANPATVTMAATGSDSNISIMLTPKGSGSLNVGGGAIIFSSNNARFHSFGLDVRSDGGWYWSNSSAYSGTKDLSLLRHGVGQLSINSSGTEGQWGSLFLGTRDGGTTTITAGLTLGHQSTGTPAAGLGESIDGNLNSSTTADQNAFKLYYKWSDATHATRTSAFGLQLVNSAAALADVLTISGAGAVAIPGTLAVTGHTTLEGVTSTGATGTGKLVYDTLPSIAGATFTGNLLFTDATYDIGANGATRPRNIYTSGTILSGGSLMVAASSAVFWNASTTLTAPSDGVLLLQNFANTGFSRAQLGGTTSSFPAIKRNGTAINFRLADDSGNAGITASTVGVGSTSLDSDTEVSINATTGTAGMAFRNNDVTKAYIGVDITGGNIVTGSATNDMVLRNGTNILFAAGGGTEKMRIDASRVTMGVPAKLKGYTVAGLPAGSQGDTAFVTDALAPTFLATIVGGGAVVTPVFYNGTNWVGY